MSAIPRSEYIRISKTIIRKLYSSGCFGKGSVYIQVLKSGIPNTDIEKIEPVLEAVIKQEICGKKKKQFGWKYYLNMEKIEKIREILK